MNQKDIKLDNSICISKNIENKDEGASLKEKCSGVDTVLSSFLTTLSVMNDSTVINNVSSSLQNEQAIMNKLKLDITRGEAYSALEEIIESSEILKFQDKQKVIGRNLTVVADYARDLNAQWKPLLSMDGVLQRSIPAANLAIMRTVPNYKELILPYGSKKVLRSLTRDTAKELIRSKDVFFDPKDRGFYCKESPDKKITADQITVLESSQDLFADISLTDLISFESQLYDDEMLALHHPVGKKIFGIIKKWNKFIKFDDITYYHARRVESGHDYYLEQEMMKAPINAPAQGRYNQIGKSCYYIAETKEGAIKEILKHCGGQNIKIQVAGIKPTKNAKLIDLSQEVKNKNNFIEHIRYSVDNDEGKIKKRYLLPNFVASCCKAVGIEGIKYKSTGYDCIVLWKDDYFQFVEMDIWSNDV